MGKPSIEFFPVSNGDMTLITTRDNKKILIDCCYREPSEDIPDVKEMLYKRLERNENKQLYIDVFLITHPDKDHTLGFQKLFHTGSPDEWKKEDDKIIINEMWSSPRVFRRACNGNTLCCDAKAINTEAKRRANLYKEKGSIGKLGNRIIILTGDEDGKTEGLEDIVADLYSEFTFAKSGINDPSINAFLLGPADKQDIAEDEEALSKNDSSAVIRFTLFDEEKYPNYFLNGGDACVKCWELIYQKMNESSQIDKLEYDVLQAPHHCSWHSLSEDSESEYACECEYEECECEKPQVNQDARQALCQARKNAFIVSSSRPFTKETPPSRLAEREYQGIIDDVDGEFIMVSDQLDENSKNTSLYLTFSNGQVSKNTPPINFSKIFSPSAVNKSGKNTYA